MNNFRLFGRSTPILLILTFFVLGCSSSEGIDNFYSFNAVKSGDFAITTQVATGQDIISPLVIKLDSIDYISGGKLRTNLQKLRSLEMTRLEFLPSDAAFALSKFDTIELRVAADSLPDIVIAGYSNSSDQVTTLNTDFSVYFKKPSFSASLRYRLRSAPTKDLRIALHYTLVATGEPLE
ncbi:MAG: hypothetical protein WCH46_00985 [bacterium]